MMGTGTTGKGMASNLARAMSSRVKVTTIMKGEVMMVLRMLRIQTIRKCKMRKARKMI
jgi:hypothetical protein